MNIRAVAAEVIYSVVDKGQSLTAVLPLAQQKIQAKDGALLQEICFGVLRWLPRLESIAQQLMDKPLTGKQRVFHHLILVGIYQLGFMRIPAHAAVAETVDGAVKLKKPQLKGLINAVLRNYQRNEESLTATACNNDAGKYGHPGWLLKTLQSAYANEWQDVVAANNQKAPMWLRVNSQHHDVDSYLALLAEQGIQAHKYHAAANALLLEKACDVKTLPGFTQGWVSVQDGAAQLAIEHLAPQANELILDCCAAPGGKTCHILEREPSAKVVAMDIDENRLTRVRENLQRLQLSAEVLCGDARYPSQWWQGQKFDRILLDAPCSATGVIRRHPDIKWLRKASDIEQLAKLQAEILQAMWQQLASGGTLVYATCSVMPLENVQQIRAFLANTPDATLHTGTPEQPGIQILPGQDNMDGFYYAVLKKA